MCVCVLGGCLREWPVHLTSVYLSIYYREALWSLREINDEVHTPHHQGAHSPLWGQTKGHRVKVLELTRAQDALGVPGPDACHSAAGQEQPHAGRRALEGKWALTMRGEASLPGAPYALSQHLPCFSGEPLPLEILSPRDSHSCA